MIPFWRGLAELRKISGKEISQTQASGLAVHRIVTDGSYARRDVNERVGEVAAQRNLMRAFDPAEIVVAFEEGEMNGLVREKAGSERKPSGDR